MPRLGFQGVIELEDSGSGHRSTESEPFSLFRCSEIVLDAYFDEPCSIRLFAFKSIFLKKVPSCPSIAS